MANTVDPEVLVTKIEHPILGEKHLHEYRFKLPVSRNEELVFRFERIFGPWNEDIPVMWTFGAGFHKFRNSDNLVWSMSVHQEKSHCNSELEVKYVILIQNLRDPEAFPRYMKDFGPIICMPDGKLVDGSFVNIPDGNYDIELSVLVLKCIIPKKEDTPKKGDAQKKEESPRQK